MDWWCETLTEGLGKLWGGLGRLLMDDTYKSQD